MILNQTAEYALRAMAILAMLAPGEGLRAADLAERTGIPVAYLSKIMRRLVLAKLVDSRKGHGGGFRLAQPPARITFLAVLSAVDLAPEPNRCAFGWGACDPRHPCVLHSVWSELSETFVRWAEKTTLADAASGGGGFSLPDVSRRTKRR